MPAHYRIDIRRDGVLLGNLNIDHPLADEALAELHGVLISQGYVCQVLQATGERRVLDSTPQGISLLFREPIFQNIESPPRTGLIPNRPGP